MGVLSEYYRVSLLIEETQKALIPEQEEYRDSEFTMLDGEGNKIVDAVAYLTYWEGL